MIHIQARRQRESRIEFAIGELREGVLVKTFRRVALTLYYELIVLHSHANVLFSYTGKNCAQIQGVIVPARLKHRAECPGALPGRVRRRRRSLSVEVLKHLVDRPAKLVQRL